MSVKCLFVCLLAANLIALDTKAETLNRTHSGQSSSSPSANDVDSDSEHFVTYRQEKTKRKENSRFLNLFSYVDIPTSACQSSQRPLRELNGTCYHPNQCAKLGGLATGQCANGLGVCCFCEDTIFESLHYIPLLAY